MKASPFLAASGMALGAAFLALAPVHHRAQLEQDPTNPVRRVVLVSRSLLGLRRPAWGVRLAGPQAWGGPGEGFFLVEPGGGEVVLTAWPGFRQTLTVPPAASGLAPLAEEGDREAFRTWFVALLEQQLEGESPAWEPAQRDCSGILRFAFREALVPHTEAWRARVGFTGAAPSRDPSPAFGQGWRAGFPTPEGVQPFARGTYLRQGACVPLGRDLQLARPGDLLFFARGGARSQPDHAMAFVRPDGDGSPMLLYHTGAEGSGASRKPGEVRRVRLDDLLHHPDPDFRPLPENPAFLGLYRWQPLAVGAPILPRS